MKAMRVLAALSLLAGSAGCAYARLQKPELEVVDVHLLKGDLLQQQLSDLQTTIAELGEIRKLAGERLAQAG